MAEGGEVRDRPTLSVVMACRDEARWLPEALAALAAEVVDGWVDTVVVDDGSTDGTAEVAEAHGRDLPGLRVIRTEPTNRSTAINVGVAASAGEAVVLLDGDDVVAPGYLATLHAALVDHPFVAARLDHRALNPRWLWSARPPRQVTELPHEPQRPWPVAGGGTLAVRREALALVGGFDEALVYAQDTDLCWRLAAAGVPLTFVPAAALRYRYRTGARAVFTQARRYGRGAVALDHRWASGPSPVRVLKRVVRLLAQVLRLPTCLTRAGRVATAFHLGHPVGWLEAALWPRRFFPPAVLAPVPAAGESAGP